MLIPIQLQRRMLFATLAFVFISLLIGLPVNVQTVEAAPTELFFSEYIEGSSNNKALEIYNGTGSSINLVGYSVQMYFNGSITPTLTISLTGTVANGDVFILAHSNANPTILAQADQTNGAGWFNGNDVVVLRKGTSNIDVIGQIGNNPGTEWGTGLASTADNTLRRKCTISAGDTNGSNAFDPSIEWDGYATDTFTGLGSHSTVCEAAPSVASTVPANAAANVALNANITVNFSEPVNVSGTWFTLSCSSSGIHSAVATGGPTIFTLNPDTDFVVAETCTLTIVASQVKDQDALDPPDNMLADYSGTFTTIGVCQLDYTHIYSIQGSGMSAAITGNVTTQGVVVGDFEGSTSIGIQGFYIQDATGDGDPATSDGIFVFTGNANTVSAGQLVRVTGFARERFNQTTLNGSNSDSSAVPAGNIANCGDGSVAATDVTMPFASIDYPERFEGMLVRFQQSLMIAEYFNYDRFGELVLALPLNGEPRPFTGTAIDEPGAPANNRTLANSLRRITLDDGLGSQNPSVLRHPNGANFSLSNRFRGGDTVQNVVGVLGYDFSLYRIQPTAPANYTAANPRPLGPGSVGNSTLRVAAMNTLNFFLTLDYSTNNPLDNKCGPLQNVECRGADSDQSTEFTRQRTKLLEALKGLDADVIGLNELENTTGVEPLGDPTNGIVAGLNASLGAGTFAYIDTGVIGTDAIRVGMIYKPSKVTPVGAFKLLTTAVDPRFVDTLNRPALAQTFQVVATGARFTAVVNHLKSKGSACTGDPDIGDGQGNCNLTRTNAAKALVDWLATDPTGSGDPDFIILGDLNSYAKEDPVKAIRAGADDTLGNSDDYTNLIAKYQGAYAYSYVFDGQFGYLDHALASQSMTAQVTGAVDWHINADEPDVLDYDTSFKPDSQDALYEPNAYRSSDHDAVVVGLNLDGTPPTLTVSVSPNELWPANHKYVTVKATVKATDNKDPNPKVTLVSVTSSEPDNGLGDGDTPIDIVIVDQYTFQLRAERSATGPGRVYTITYKATDAYGNTSTKGVTVTVPHDKGN
ncbi:MAG: ExeM/NucH family extracellular endonuclease [Chloroflexi bacterium]|nr:ExeM/NucH family extracellular endonuclease [Chloroflexota bacterium]